MVGDGRRWKEVEEVEGEAGDGGRWEEIHLEGRLVKQIPLVPRARTRHPVELCNSKYGKVVSMVR